MRGTVTTALVVLAATVLCADAASADPASCTLVNPTTGTCVVEAVGPGSVGGVGNDAPASDPTRRPEAGADRGSAAAPDEVGTPVCLNAGQPVPCSTDKGFWRQDVGCYISATPANPQPAEGTAMWEHFEREFNSGPDTGAVYPCFDVAGVQVSLVYSPNPPEAGPPLPSPGEVARQAVAQMDLQAIRIGITPGPGEVGIVGLPTWLWADGVDATTFGPVTRTATVRGVSVTATARVREVVWDMGDGAVVRCASAGTPYEARFGKNGSPDCGHTYTQDSGDQPDGTFTVSATSHWVVEWEGAGQQGTITLDGLTSEVAVTIGEAQVLVS
ncbi:hypothetical protein [Antribacter gilvus]|uniref:hypothetical protein n=1 Tax=Antribacter gilvus TaxID=2304675 RepID=UPI000F795F41|nr:hypothetical protein [Antribacter gilvus]